MPDFKYPTVQIEAYNLAEFCKKVQEAFTKGFRFDLDTNQNYPTAFGAYYSAGMQLKVEPSKDFTYTTVLDQDVEKEVSTAQVIEQVTEQVAQGAQGADYTYETQDTQQGTKSSTRASKKA